ncbi:MAG: pyrimidine dimer DNA glycosylase/endonuclease V [Anaerolineales bacterium]
MRLWSLSPTYLDRLGLVGLWREGLLAQRVIAGTTDGYKHHPQLIRFQSQEDPLRAIGQYLVHVAEEGDRRGYRFKREKILHPKSWDLIPVTQGQLSYEFSHLLHKLQTRDRERYQQLKSIETPQAHPSFAVIPGKIAPWEKI